MIERRRHLAVAVAVMVAWMSLWSFVSSTHARLVGASLAICHQAGTTVSPAEVPKPFGAPAESHCPLCIMAFHGVGPVELAVPPPPYAMLSVAPAILAVAFIVCADAPCPPSRAPPSRRPG